MNEKNAINRKPLPAIVALESGKLPPQALDLEEAVLGALMLEKEALSEVSDILSSNSFYKEIHQKIYAAIIDLFHAGKPIDILTVTEELKKRGELDCVGGPFFIAKLTNRVASSANVEYHARIIQQKYIAREIIRISSDNIRDAYDEGTDIFDLLDTAEKNIFSVASFTSNKNTYDLKNLLVAQLRELELINNNNGELSGVASGLTQLDRNTNGWQKTDFIIIAARPSMGKTSLALNVARNAAALNKPVAFFSLEMSAGQLTRRYISSESGIPLSILNKGRLGQLWERIVQVDTLPMWIDDTPGLSIFDFRRKARKLKAEKGIELIVVDYIQLMTVPQNSKSKIREQEISEITRGLKNVAKELNIPIIALSQLNRDTDKRTDPKPKLSDLRESGAIEQDADIVIFIYRPSYYNIREDSNGPIPSNAAWLIVAKHRNGSTETIQVRWDRELTKFSDWMEESNFNNVSIKNFYETEKEPF